MKRTLVFLASGFILATLSISAVAGTCRYPNGDEASCSRNQILRGTAYVPGKGEAPLSAAELDAQRQIELGWQHQDALALEEQQRRALILQRPDSVQSLGTPLPGQIATMCTTSYGSCGVPSHVLVGASCWCVDPGSSTFSGTATAP